MMRNPEQTIGNMADKLATSFICYTDGDGYPVTRAMLKPRERDGIKTFWFTTNTSSNKVAALRKNPKASIYFLDKRFFRGASLCGTFEVMEDAQTQSEHLAGRRHGVLPRRRDRPGLLRAEIHGRKRQVLQ